MFKPPNPWITGILSLMAEIYHTEKLKLNLTFEIEMLFRNFNLQISDTRVSKELVARKRDMTSGTDFAIDKQLVEAAGLISELLISQSHCLLKFGCSTPCSRCAAQPGSSVPAFPARSMTSALDASASGPVIAGRGASGVQTSLDGVDGPPAHTSQQSANPIRASLLPSTDHCAF